METFTDTKNFDYNPNYEQQRQKALSKINYQDLDKTTIELVKQINSLPYCFTLQCCYGHFLYTGQTDEHNLNPIPKSNIIKEVEYRIAYLSFCILDCEEGRGFLNKLNGLTKIDPQNIQSGCADWFWERQVNSFVLQVEPDRFKYFDKAILDYQEALHIESVRNQFFKKLNPIITEMK